MYRFGLGLDFMIKQV